MAPSKTVSGDAVVGVLRGMQKPYATTTDIAEGLDVTAQTVRNNAGLLSQDNRINKGSVGQSSVYWLAERSSHQEKDDDDTDDTTDTGEVNLSLPKNEALSNWSQRLKRLSVALGLVALLPALAVFALSPAGVGALGLVGASFAMIGLAVVGVLSVVVLAFAKLFEEVSKIAVSPGQTTVKDGDTA